MTRGWIGAGALLGAALTVSAGAACSAVGDAASPSFSPLPFEPDQVAQPQAEAGPFDMSVDELDAGNDLEATAMDALVEGEASSCPNDRPDACPMPVPSYMNSVAAIFKQRCNPCHFPNGVEYRAVDLSTYQGVHQNLTGALINVSACPPIMPPPDAAALMPSERQTLLAWLVCGAPNN